MDGALHGGGLRHIDALGLIDAVFNVLEAPCIVLAKHGAKTIFNHRGTMTRRMGVSGIVVVGIGIVVTHLCARERPRRRCSGRLSGLRTATGALHGTGHGNGTTFDHPPKDGGDEGHHHAGLEDIVVGRLGHGHVRGEGQPICKHGGERGLLAHGHHVVRYGEGRRPENQPNHHLRPPLEHRRARLGDHGGGHDDRGHPQDKCLEYAIHIDNRFLEQL